MLFMNFAVILGMYRRLGLLGLYVWIPLAVIVANIQVIKTIELFGLTATLGNIAYASTFLATDIISENHGKSAANKAVWIGFVSIIAMTVFMNTALWYKPSPDDFAQEALTTIFGLMPRIALGSVAAYLVSQKHDIWAYQFWKERFPSDRAIWIRNNASTMVSQALDTIVFVAIAFWGQFPLSVLVEIFITTYVIKWLVAVLDTPFMYAAKYMYKKGLAGPAD
ncbi:MAG: queuosine precursor transporter [Spirochaetota bacterium]